MSAINSVEDLKKELIALSSTIKKVDVIPVDGGIVIEAIDNQAGLKDLKDKILMKCVEKHQEAPKGQNYFPYKIFCYKTEEDAFCVDASLDPKEREDLSTIVLDGSGLIIIREIDAEAIIFKRKTPFVLKFKDSSNQFYRFNDKARYKALSFLGYSFAFEFEKKFKKIEDGKYWEVTVYQD